MIKRMVTKEQREKKEKRGKIVFGILIAALMVMSTLGYAIQSNTQEAQQEATVVKYNGFEFTQVNGLWVTGNYVFRYNPKDISENVGQVNTASSYVGKPLYLQSEDDTAGIELYINMAQVATRVGDACLEDSGIECTEGLPMKTCADNFIIIKEDDTNSVRQQENCVFIEGKKEDLAKLTDEFLFKILGIK